MRLHTSSADVFEARSGGCACGAEAGSPRPCLSGAGAHCAHLSGAGASANVRALRWSRRVGLVEPRRRAAALCRS
eukprot:317408-Pleurochrysis_carterae.AAC.1